MPLARLAAAADFVWRWGRGDFMPRLNPALRCQSTRTRMSSPSTAPALPPHGERPWWREPQLLILVAIIVAIYFSRLTTLTIRGEESRRARVACEMIETGDWIVPRQQGQVYISRPPLGSWPIALCGLARGIVDTTAVRLPTVIATLLTTILVYGYGRRLLSPRGALAAGLAMGTMAQVLELGRLAETEATFTLLVAGSLLGWHAGYMSGRRPALAWLCGYGLAALAGLAKGPQGPLYFCAVVVVYLFIQRDWRFLFSRAHLKGIVVFVAIIAAWQVPYYLATDAEATKRIWLKLASDRFVDNRPGVLVKHLLMYPLEVFCCMLPWSVTLTGFFLPSFRRTLGPVRPYIVFLVTALAVTFPSVWLATGARGRYYMPLYPCMAVIAGLVIDRATQAGVRRSWRQGWMMFNGTMITGVLAAGVLLAYASFSGKGPGSSPAWAAMAAQPPAFAAFYLAAALVTVGVLLRSGIRGGPFAARWAAVTLAAFMGLSFTGALINTQSRLSEDNAGSVADLRQHLPPKAQLVSLGRVDHLFAYYYRQPIRALPWPQSPSALPRVGQYFCFDRNPDTLVLPIPFRWELVDVAVLDRHKMPAPGRVVVVGRRIDGPPAEGEPHTLAHRPR